MMYIFDNDLLSIYLKEKKMSQAELAKITHITESTICHYVKGNRTPSLNNFFKICAALDCNLSDLIVRL